MIARISGTVVSAAGTCQASTHCGEMMSEKNGGPGTAQQKSNECHDGRFTLIQQFPSNPQPPAIFSQQRKLKVPCDNGH